LRERVSDVASHYGRCITVVRRDCEALLLDDESFPGWNVLIKPLAELFKIACAFARALHDFLAALEVDQFETVNA
jgi:hypothetical protein